MDNVGIVVESLDAAISFFAELGLELEGRAMIEGDWSGRVTGLRDQRVEIAMMRTPDGHGRIELSRFLTPPAVADHRNAPVNALGYLRVMFAVDDLDDTLARLRGHGATGRRRSGASTKTCTGSATSEAPRAFSSDWPSKSPDVETRSGVRTSVAVRRSGRSRVRTPTEACQPGNAGCATAKTPGPRGAPKREATQRASPMAFATRETTTCVGD
jgi:catechol 2,3-dioxygenase-like lactoylglutathione lyase family enzyme